MRGIGVVVYVPTPALLFQSLEHLSFHQSIQSLKSSFLLCSAVYMYSTRM